MERIVIDNSQKNPTELAIPSLAMEVPCEAETCPFAGVYVRGFKRFDELSCRDDEGNIPYRCMKQEGPR